MKFAKSEQINERIPAFARRGLDEKVGSRIKEARKEQGVSRRILAKRASIGYGTLGRIERGHQRPTEPTLRRIARALKLRLGDLAPGWTMDELERGDTNQFHPGPGLRSLRMRENKSIVEVARVAGVNPSTLSRFERALHASRKLVELRGELGSEDLVFRSEALAHEFGFDTAQELSDFCNGMPFGI